MRNILRYIVCACLALALGGCIKDEIVGNNFCRDGLLSLNIGINETRAEGDNDNGNADLTLDRLPLNENRIDNYEVFLFESGATGEATGEAKFSAYFSDVNATDSTTNNAISVPAGALAELFDSGDTCNIYVVANLGKSLASELENASTSLTLANLKAHTVSANFTTTAEIVDYKVIPRNSAPIQSNFVMDSSGTDTVTKSGNNLTGEVYITRAASKISFMAYVGDSMTIDGKVWRPDLENIQVAFNNVVVKGAIDNGSDTEKTFSMPQVKDLYNNLSGVQLTNGVANTGTPEFGGTVQGVTSWHKVDILVPFYTYSSIWSAEEKTVNPSIVLTVPWFVEGNKSTTLTNYNYTIPLTAADGDLKLVRNKHYRIALRVGVLGDLDQLASSEFSYEVLDWVGNDIKVDLSDPKYFVVDENYVEVYNQDSYGVNYKASDVVSAQILSVIKPDYSTTNANNERYIYGSANSTSGDTTFSPTTNDDGLGNTNPFTVSVENGQIVLKHELNNEILDVGFDFVPYIVKVRATMTITDSADNTTTMYEDIIFKQYPAIYVQNHLTDDGDTNSNLGSGTNNNGYGYVMVNTLFANRVNYTDSNSSIKWQTVESFDSSSYNPNMYVITTTALGSSMDGYILADSRDLSVNQTSQNVGFTGIADVNGKYLTKYHPTKTDNENYLSPKFRICSAYGQLGDNSLTLQQAKNRCAAYQEDGYPAGRWRLATKAELRYIALLCSKGAIPSSLFGSSNYWCATTRLKVDTGGGEVSDQGNQSTAYMRCVYDDWYWGSEQLNDKTEYTWGDQMTTAELNKL